MKFPDFGIKEILAAVVDGKAEHLDADDYEMYAGAEDGSILVVMPGFTVIMGPTADGQMVKFAALDENGQEFALVYGYSWYAI